MLTIWDLNVFLVSEAVEKQHFLAIKGKWVGKETELVVINVYGPHKDADKKKMWESLENVMCYPNVEWVLGGDFNESWGDISATASDRNTSDHCPIVLNDKNIDFGPKTFKLFNLWLESKDVEKIITEAWNKEVFESKDDCKFRDKMKNVKETLRSWSKNKYGVLDFEIESWKKKVMELEAKADNGSITDSERDKARSKWDFEGDDNTAFFHATIRKRYNSSSIRGLHIDGIWDERHVQIKKEVFEFFGKVFGAKQDSTPDFNSLILFPLNSINSDEAQMLESPFQEAEIWEAIKECDASRAPGPDVFNLGFFKKLFWLIKDDLKKAVDWFWSKESISKGCNASFITLIPKKKLPMNLGDYRPISLIESYYKIIAKMLSKRLQKVIHKVINVEQSAFLKGRFILDGILVANELVDEVKRQKNKCLIFKVDFEKAFDSINWDFLLKILEIMGFGLKWRSWTKACITSAMVSVLVNGSPTKEFSFLRGIRQGDPLSPYLFIIMAEGLNTFIKRALEGNLFKGVEIGKDRVSISHLQYADDTIIFGDWRVQTSVVEEMARLFGCLSGALPFSYLGLPIGRNMNNIWDWEPFIDKIHSRLADWKAKSMSFGGRLTLIKSVLSSLPLYAFFLFRAPSCVINKLEGGLNIGSLNAKNFALLAKCWWRFYNDKNSLWVKIITSIYGRDGGLGAHSINNVSGAGRVWNSIRNIGRFIDNSGIQFTNSFVKKVCKGDNTCFWTDKWLVNQPLCEEFRRLFRLEQDKDVVISNRFAKKGGASCFSWSWSRVPTGRTLSELHNLTPLLNNFEFQTGSVDSWHWNLHPNGLFYTHEVTKIIDGKMLQEFGSQKETERIPFLPQKVGLFVWRVKQKRIPVRTELDKRGIDLDSVRCPVCNKDLETAEHILLHCDFAKDLWSRIFKWWNANRQPYTILDDLFQGIHNSSQPNQKSILWKMGESTGDPIFPSPGTVDKIIELFRTPPDSYGVRVD
ncbi:uncharacterized protein [Rutidosis leptorrhynchoides]|uniref:uncharacterized protein n=1 Tax=Rutidosis leptorrhynchoides TaxID=125765 RepID=UPI003A99C9BB